MRWVRSSAYSVACEDYGVSKATVLDLETGELAERFSAWYGPDLLAQPRATARPATLLGIRQSAAEAKALCATHQAERGRAAPDSGARCPGSR
jgi:hypothetical protein